MLYCTSNLVIHKDMAPGMNEPRYDTSGDPQREARARQEAMARATEDQISRADEDELADMLDKATDAFLKDPEIFKRQPEAMKALNAINQRTKELRGRKDTKH